MRFNKERWDFGKQSESDLLPQIELLIGEPLTPTEKLYDTMDAVSENHWIEIKSRTPKYHWDNPKIQKEGWLIPASKIERARKESRTGKQIEFFYYWKSDSSLWFIIWDETIVSDLTPSVPFWHPDKQLHYYIPFDRWTQV